MECIGPLFKPTDLSSSAGYFASHYGKTRVVTSDTNCGLLPNEISHSLPDNATLGQRIVLFQKLSNLMKITTRNAKRNPLEEIFAGYFVLKESGMVTGIEVTWESVCRGMYYCWGTDPKQSTPMKMDRIYSTGCVPDCTQNHFRQSICLMKTV